MSTTPPAPAPAPELVALRANDWVMLALPGLIWGSSFYLIAVGLDAISPYLITWLRIGFGLCVIASVPAARVDRKRDRRGRRLSRERCLAPGPIVGRRVRARQWSTPARAASDRCG